MQATRPVDQTNSFIAFFFIQFLLHLIMVALLITFTDLTIVLKLSPNNMLKQLIVCDINKASLGLPTKLLRECAKEISPSLCRLFNMSLVLGAFTENGKR